MKKRRRFVVVKDLQFKFTFLFLIFVFAFLLLVLCTVWYTTWVSLSPQTVFSERELHRSFVELSQRIFWLSLGFFGVGGILGVILGILFTHRIAGPLYRIRRDMEAVLEGEEVTPITLRKKDELKEFATDFTRVLDLIERLRGERKKVMNLVSWLGKTLKEEKKEGISQEKLQEILQRLDSLKKENAGNPSSDRELHSG